MKKILIIFLCSALLGGCNAENIADEMPDFFSASHEENVNSDVLNIALCGVAEFQPHAVTGSSAAALDFVYEPLFDITSEGVAVPVLAESLTNNGRDITINLRQDVKWHDGTAFTAADAVYTINLVKDGKSVYSSDIIENVYAVNNTSIRVRLTRAVEKAEKIFVFPIVKNKSPMSVKKPIGTGPYSYSEKKAYDTYTFIPFDDGTKKEFTRINMINIRDPQREKELFQSGEADVIKLDNEQLMYYTPRANAQLYTYPTNQMVYIGFNCESTTAAMRRAIMYAIDRGELVKKILAPTAVVSSVFEMPGEEAQAQTGQNPAMAEGEMSAGGYEYDGEMYRKNGSRVKVRVIAQPGGKHLELAELFCSKLENFGIKCTIKNQEQYYDDTESGAYEIIIGTMTTDGEPGSILKPGNLFNYSSDILNNMLETSVNTADINNLAVNDVPLIPLAYRCEAISVSKKIQTELKPSYTAPFNGIIY